MRYPARYHVLMIYVIGVRHAGEFRLALEFDDDTQGVADLSELVRLPVFAPLQDEGTFRRAYVDDGTVCWPVDLDVPSERLYALAHGLPVPRTLEQAMANEHAVRARREERARSAQG